MICQQCHAHPATVHYQQTAGGVTHEYYLCSACAATNGFAGNGFSLLGSLFGGAHSHTPKATKRCTFCGSTYAQIADSGKIGCAKCYEIFADELASTITAIHGADVAFVPRDDTPKSVETVAPAEEDALAVCRRELAAAIAREDYEEAAILRDKIRAMQAE